MEVDGESVPSLEETFYILSKKNTVYRVRLSEKGLCLQKESNGNVKREMIALNDIVGCKCLRSKRTEAKCLRRHKSRMVEEDSLEKDESDASAYLYIYAYVLKKSKVKCSKKRERMVITLRFRSFDKYEENLREAHKWKVSIKYLLETQLRGQSLPASFFISSDLRIENKLLVILNPKSGVGRARDVFHHKVVPLFTEADLNYDLHVTSHAQHARSLIRNQQNMWQYMGGIVVVGGDGILFEVINGLMERSDWEVLFNELKLGIIPCGSGNGLAKSISYAFNEPHDNNPVLVSALNIVRGISTPLDLVRIETTNGVIYSFLSIGWGLLSDIDIESERLRSIGSQRFVVWSLARLIGLRTYRGTVSYLPVGSERVSSRKQIRSISEGDCESDVLSDEGRRDSFYSVGSKKSTYQSIAGSSYESLVEDPVKTFGPPSHFPSLSQPIPSNWVVVKGNFVMVHASYPSHLATDCFFAPSARLNDGCIWLCIIRSGISRHHLAQFLLGLSSGTQMEVPGVEMVAVSGFRIEPESGGSHMAVDGEQIDVGPIQAQLLPSAVSVFARAH